MLEVEPVFEVLNQHLELLVQSGSGVLSEDSLLLVSSETSNQSLAFNDTFDWEDTSDQDTQAEEKLLPTAQEAIESNLNIDTEIKVRAAEVGDMHKAQITGDADDLNDLFTTGLDEQPLLETDTNQIKFENLEVVNAPQAPGENSFDGKDSVSSFNETLAFDDLFGVETPLLLVTEESEFCNLFDQPKESQDQILLEELTPTSAIEDIDSENESVTPPQMEFELEESWFSLDSGDRLVDVPPKETFTPSLIKSEATAATELDSIDNLNTAGELSSTFDDFWDEQPELLTALDSSLSIDLSEAGEKNAPTLKDESVLPEVDGSVTAANLQRRLDNNDLIDTTETDLFTSLGEKSNQYLNFLLDDPADQVGIETLSDINIDFSSAEVVDDEFDALEALLADETTSTDDFFELDALLDLEPPTLYAVTQQDLSEDVLSAETTDDEFGDLEALLGETTANTAPQSVDTDEFSELDSLLI